MKKVLAFSAFAVLATGSQATIIVYDNIEAPSHLSGATTDAQTNAIWGDQLALTSGGVLDSFKMGLFNSSFGGNTGLLLSATVNVKFYDLGTGPYTAGALTTKPLLGQFTAGFGFGLGLAVDRYAFMGLTDLSSLNINLTQNVMVTQQVVSFTGGTNRLGVMTYSTENVGASYGPDKFYRKNSTAEGLIGFNSPTSNKLTYEIGIVPEPATMAVLGLGVAALLRRRKKA